MDVFFVELIQIWPMKGESRRNGPILSDEDNGGIRVCSDFKP